MPVCVCARDVRMGHDIRRTCTMNNVMLIIKTDYVCGVKSTVKLQIYIGKRETGDATDRIFVWAVSAPMLFDYYEHVMFVYTVKQKCSGKDTHTRAYEQCVCADDKG